MQFPIDDVRAQFPALSTKDGDQPRIYFDAPGGTQICSAAIDRMSEHLKSGTANDGGAFQSSRDTQVLVDDAHSAMADLLGGRPEEIAFGANMTSLTLAVSRALAQEWNIGDELVVTRLDHDANIAPWLLVARDRGMTVRWLDFDPESGRLALDELPGLLGPRTRLVAVGGASNALGTLNDVAEVCRIVKQHSKAIVFVDAVQSVPHVVTDVQALGCDVLTCSPYKFFGPHQGVLWARRTLLERLDAYKVRPATIDPPAARFETGTQSFEAQAGVLGTIAYFEWLAARLGKSTGSRRDRLTHAVTACELHERTLGERLLSGLSSIENLKLWGPASMDGRVPTFSFTMQNHAPGDVATFLAEEGIFAWSGSFYAIEVVDRLGLAETGGLVRVGLCHYHTHGEVDYLITALKRFSAMN
ncbi:MAG: cysteine desulfurase-like protein [Actinobacteria bacterium]|nr:cysteine desulfurase-like protein [Actinomycetota bacterium]